MNAALHSKGGRPGQGNKKTPGKKKQFRRMTAGQVCKQRPCLGQPSLCALQPGAEGLFLAVPAQAVGQTVIQVLIQIVA